jgi:hypothetical protein
MKDISSSNYKAYERAFDTLNVELFDGKLPAVVLTLRAGRNTNGYAWAKRFRLHDDSVPVDIANTTETPKPANLFDEIAINPATVSRPPRDVLGTLLHEMCHIWQINFGKPSRGGYHNTQWASKMIEVGLRPFSVKNPTQSVGQACSHTIEGDGIADRLFARIEASFGADLVVELPILDGAKKKTKNSKVKFTCPNCGANAWGKDSLHIKCADCDTLMVDKNADPLDGDNEDEDTDDEGEEL